MPAKVGVLALQGAFARHIAALEALGAAASEVRQAHQLADVDALVMPGGESTTMSHLLGTSGMFDVIAERLGEGLPVLGTCAGMILLATEVLDGRPDQRSFGALDIAVRRNAFGRQIDSFEADLAVEAIDSPERPFHGVFIRAPFVERVGAGVDVLATVDDHAVLVRRTDGKVWAAAFHPELSDDHRLHQQFLQEV